MARRPFLRRLQASLRSKLKLRSDRRDRRGQAAPETLSDLLSRREVIEASELPPSVLKTAEGLVRSAGPSVSVVVPTWNRVGTLCDAVASALRQVLAPIEVIVSDDGSTDGTEAAIRRRFAREISTDSVVYSGGSHVGVSAARNRALERARGDFIAYLDSDNRWEREHLLLAVGAVLATPHCECAYTAMRWTNRDTGVIELRGASFDRKRLLRANYIDLNTFVHRRSLFERLGGFDPQLRRLVDWDLILKFTRDSTPAFVPAVTVRYYLDSLGLRNITLVEDVTPNLEIIRARYSGEGSAARGDPLPAADPARLSRALGSTDSDR